MPGLEAPAEIDLIAEDGAGNALLSIVQTGPWSADDGEVNALQQKLGNYVGYALDGQMLRDYPSLAGRPVIVELRHDAALPGRIAAYWAHASEVASREGVTLSTRLLTAP